MSIDFTLWPNPDGNLGNIKVQIPTGIGNDEWPNGDALINNIVYKDGKISGFVDTKALIANSSNSTTFPYDYVNIQVDKSLEGVMTFNKGERTKYLIITYTGSSSGGSETFDFVIIDFATADQETIDTVRTAKRVVDNKLYDADDNLIGTIDTSKIEVGGIIDEEAMMADGLFCNLDINSMDGRGLILSEFNSDLSSLRNGNFMFSFCSNLTSFSSDLSNLTNGQGMFGYCTNLTTFTSDLPSLRAGEEMFNTCINLTAFSSDLSSLTNGYFMFYACPLTLFNSNLFSLTNGCEMFSTCKLNTESVKCIVNTINDVNDLEWGDSEEADVYKRIYIGMGCDATETDVNLFAQEAGYADMTSLLAVFEDKGWDVNAQYNGRPTTTYGLRRTTEDTLPVFVKLEETEDHANYTSMDGSKKYRLNWFHETTGSTEGYTQFASLEEAVTHFNINPIERN